MSVAAIILNYKRAPNIPIIINSLLKAETTPNEIIIIDNNPESKLQVKDATLIKCSRNFGCIIRHTLGLALNYTHCLFIDDDLNPRPQTLGGFIHWNKKFPEAILGHYGVVVNPKHNRPYGGGSRINTKKMGPNPHKVDIVLGRIHFCKTTKLAQAFTMFSKALDYPPHSSGVDDILLSLANRHYGYKNYVIPTDSKSATHNLPDFGTGLYKRKNHFRLRNHATRLLLDVKI